MYNYNIVTKRGKGAIPQFINIISCQLKIKIVSYNTKWGSPLPRPLLPPCIVEYYLSYNPVGVIYAYVLAPSLAKALLNAKWYITSGENFRYQCTSDEYSR